jgi:hypothetical protein
MVCLYRFWYHIPREERPHEKGYAIAYCSFATDMRSVEFFFRRWRFPDTELFALKVRIARAASTKILVGRVIC